MIGPSIYVQINMGSRYVPCMKNIEGVQDAKEEFTWPCPNTTTTNPQDPRNSCSLSELCGLGGVPNPQVGGNLQTSPSPDQWYRFIIPMFLHAGFIHIGMNMLAQLTMGVEVERMVGWWRYLVVYLASGIWGFVMGGNYAGQGLSSTGCSGSLFGIVALYLLDLLYTFNERPSAWIELVVMLVGVAVSFIMGLLPGLDNFCHIGGFVMGLALGLCILRSPNILRERISRPTPYVAMSGAVNGDVDLDDNNGGGDDDDKKRKTNRIGFGAKNNYFNKSSPPLVTSMDHHPSSGAGPLTFFKNRKPLWWAWWLVRMGALVAVLIGFILLIVDFYKYPKSNCSWCYRLSCLVGPFSLYIRLVDD